ncbi:zonadhesin-like [Candoia aspera]|uniref:zonadhesin-like n=1 Tax=Candoia aspera TaxID=51853 RepID=UPI002FD847AC
MPGVGPTDDFSRPGFGSYMLLSPFNEGSRGSAFLKSPTFSPGGCLVLSFYYTLHGTSDDTALKVYAAAPGEELGVLLLSLSGEHGPHWRPGAANYTGRKSIQFIFEGTLAGNPGLAVDSVAISPCGEIFAACNFNDNTDPFCGWHDPADNNVIWIRTNQGTPTEDTGPPGDYPHGDGYYIFAEAGFLKPGESTRLSSRPFCIDQEACVEFYYHMHSIVAVETQLRVLLEGPSGAVIGLWNCTGNQSPSWLFGSVTIPYGGAQPSTVTFEVVRGRNAYLDVALDNISVHRGRCAATPVPPSTSSIASSTAGGPVVTVPPEQPTISWPTIVTFPSPTTFNASTTTKATVTKSHPTTLSSTGDSAQSTRPGATTTVTPHSSASPGQGNQTTTGLPNSSQTPSCATPISTQTSPPSPVTTSSSVSTTVSVGTTSQGTVVPTRNESLATPTGPPSTGQTSPPSPVTTSSVSTTVSVGSTSQGTVVPTRNESLATPTGPPSTGQTSPPSPVTTSSVSTTVSVGTTSQGTVVPTRNESLATPTGPPSTGQTSPPSPVTASSVSTTVSVGTTSQGTVVPTRNESLATPTGPPGTGQTSSPSPVTTSSVSTTVSVGTTSQGTVVPTRNESLATPTGPPGTGQTSSPSPVTTSSVSTTVSVGSTSQGTVVPTRNESLATPTGPPGTGQTSPPSPVTTSSVSTTVSVGSTSQGTVVPTRNESLATPTGPPSTGQTSPPSPVTTSSVSTTVSVGCTGQGTVVPTRNESLATPTGPPSTGQTSPPSPVTTSSVSTTVSVGTTSQGTVVPTRNESLATPTGPPGTGQTSSPSPVTTSSVSTTVSVGSTSHGTVVPTRNESLATPTGPPSTGQTSPPSPVTTSSVSTTVSVGSTSQGTVVPTRNESLATPTGPPSTGQTSPPSPVTTSSVSTTVSVGSTSQGTVVPTRNESLATSTGPPSSTTTTTSGGDLGPTPPTSASSTSNPGHNVSTTPSHVSSTAPSARPSTDPSSSVHPSSPTTATLPDITVPTRTASTPKLTTTLQPTTGISSPSKPLTPSSVLTSSTTSKSPQPTGPSTTQPLPTDHIGTPKPTSKRPGTDQTTPRQPPDRALCTVSGDPHYTTYDGRLFHFMGNCTYLLTAACNATPGQPTFQVQTTNEHRGSNTQVSYLKSVSVAVHGMQIVLLKGRRVTVDGKRVTLPVSVAAGRVSVRLSGTFVLVQTDFGLLVRFDGNHHADVSVPSSYIGELCGLCGNFNGEAADDNLMPNGTSAGADDNRLGESWQVPNVGDARQVFHPPGHGRCHPADLQGTRSKKAVPSITCTMFSYSCINSGDPGECDPEIAAEAQGPTSCGILTDPQGPFAPCHGKVPPQGAFESCIYDLCGTGGDAGLLCFALQSYADRCAQAGVTITWRNSTFCPLNCPPGSSYTPCGPACPSTCTDPDAQNSCPDLPCVEGCTCDQGVLSGDQCVLLSQCGCTDASGHYHAVGESWMGNLNCTQRCSCAAGNQITCEEWSCTPVQECRPVEGLLGCQDTGVASCHVAGDPHYFTFDGKMVSFMGTCTYTLVAVCQHDPRLPAFNITAKNEERGQPEASYLRLVTVKLEGVAITLQKGRRVLIDGQRVRTPVEGRIPRFSITSSGIYVVLETDFGLVVKFDGNHHLEIQLPGTYFGKVCGMCGNFNNQSTDDYLMPNGHLAANDTQFGNSWKAPGDADAGCQPDDRLDLHPNCSHQELERLHVLCLEVMAPKYQPCHSIIDPKLFFQNCLYDMCEYQGMTSVLCDNIQAYVEACKSHGVTGISWRNSTFCPLPCPPNSHFTECASPCPATCSNLYAPAHCHLPTPCVEGCACDRGHVLSDYTCVPTWECGCLDSKQEYHNARDTWITSDCLNRCTCLGGGEIRCQPFHCLPGSQCSVSTDGSRYCRPTTIHQCVISGDPHYRTFDNFVHHFQGRCTYTLARTLGQLPEALEPLSVAGRNYRRSVLQRVSFLREVYVEVLGHRITLMQGRKMAVNGVMVTPPYSPRDGLQITQRGRSLFVQTSFGLSVSFDGKNAAEIVLPSTYQKHVGGLCGNYDGQRNNEYMKPDGKLTRSLNTFGNSWQVSAQRRALDGGSGDLGPARVRRQEPAEEPESGFEVDCTPEQLAFVNGTTVCGALAAPAGPFSACHGVVSPAPFQESCVYDMCALFNDTELLCQDFEAYVQLCQEEGVDLGLWREKTGCMIQCPAHTSYQPCMSACPASCANLAAPSACEAPCVEGCASAPGYVLSGLVSVPYNQCGCSHNSQYYQINETFMTEDCSQRCTCRFTEVLECSPAGCGEGEICAVASYVRDCFRDSPCLSSPCQNEGTCQEASGGFVCLCLEGYIGLFCEEALLDDVSPAPSAPNTTTTTTTTTRLLGVSSTSQALPGGTLTTKPEGSNLMDILLGVFISLAILLLLTLIIVCVCRHRNKRKMDEDRVAVLSTPGEQPGDLSESSWAVEPDRPAVTGCASPPFVFQAQWGLHTLPAAESLPCEGRSLGRATPSSEARARTPPPLSIFARTPKPGTCNFQASQRVPVLAECPPAAVVDPSLAQPQPCPVSNPSTGATKKTPGQLGEPRPSNSSSEQEGAEVGGTTRARPNHGGAQRTDHPSAARQERGIKCRKAPQQAGAVLGL